MSPFSIDLEKRLLDGIAMIYADTTSTTDQKSGKIKTLVAGEIGTIDLNADQRRVDSADVARQGQQLMLEELMSPPFTRNARPMVVYAGLVFIGIVHVIVPTTFALLHRCLGKIPQGLSLPDGFWWAWSRVVGSWVVGRSYEKVNKPNQLSQLVTGTPSTRRS